MNADTPESRDPLENRLREFRWRDADSAVVEEIVRQWNRRSAVRRDFSALPWFLAACAAAALLVVLGLTYWKGAHAPDVGPRGGFADGREATEAEREAFTAFQREHRLAGVLGESIIIERVDTGEQKTLAVNARIDGYSLTEIRADRVVLTTDDGVVFTWSIAKGEGDRADGAGTTETAEADSPESAGNRPPFRLHGTVRDREGKPVADAVVRAYGTRRLDGANPSNDVGEGRTDEQGRYEFECFAKVEMVLSYPKGCFLWIIGEWTADAEVNLHAGELPSFTIRGSVRNAKGMPVVSAPIWGYVKLSDGGLEQSLYARTDAQGAYCFSAYSPVALLRTQIGDARIEAPGPWSADATVDIDARTAGIYGLQGNLRDDQGRPLADVSIRAVIENDTDIGMKTDAAGHFEARTNQTITALRMQHLVSGVVAVHVKAGPWNADQTLEIVLRDQDAFMLRGIVQDEAGQSVAKAWLAFYGESGAFLTQMMTDASGRFSMLSSMPVAYINVHFLGVMHRHPGPWSKDAELVISPDAIPGLVVLQGTVTGLNGKPMSGVQVRAHGKDRGNSAGRAMTDDAGRYRLLSTGDVHLLSLWREVSMRERQSIDPSIEPWEIEPFRMLEIQGKWRESATVDIALASFEVFELQVRVMKGAAPQPGAIVEAIAANSESLGFLISDAEGWARFVTQAPIAAFNVRVTGMEARRQGDWRCAAEVVVNLLEDIQAEITGVVVDENNLPMENAGIYAQARMDGGWKTVGTATTDAKGGYRLQSAGVVERLQISRVETPMSRVTHLLLAGPWKGAAVVDVSLAELPGLFSLSGMARNPEGLPAAKASFSIVNADGDSGFFVDCDARGEFRFRTNQEVTALVFEGINDGGFISTESLKAMKITGPWKSDTELTIQLEREE